MNDCNGNGECVTGKCICKDGLYGADCSISPKSFGSSNLVLNGTGWAFYRLKNSKDVVKLSARSNSTEFHVYTRRGDVPSQSFHEWFVKGEKVEVFLSKETSGEFIAIFNPDFDNAIEIDFSVSEKSEISQLIWILLTVGAILSTAIVFTVIFVLRLRRNKRKGDFSPLRTPITQINS